MGAFDINNIFSFDAGKVSTYKQFYINGTTSINYYILPENQRVHNYMTPTVEVTTTCPGQANGTATITIEGGFAPYTLVLHKPDDTQVTEITSNSEYTFENLEYGSYNCVITDNYNNVVEIDFDIEYVEFDVEDNLYEVNSTRVPPGTI